MESLVYLEDKLTEITKNINKETFIYDFISLYNFPKVTITKLQKGINNLAKEKNEIYLRNKFYFKVVDLELLNSLLSIEEKLNGKDRPRYIIVTDFKNFVAKDTKTEEMINIKLEELGQNYSFFLAWNNIEKVDFNKENPMDIKAAERFSRIYDELTKLNPEINEKELNLFLTRILFCFFAEDTEIFEKNIFTNDLQTLTDENESNLNETIEKIFEVMSKENAEKKFEHLKKYPYVNGNLFSEPHTKLNFNEKLRKLIIEAGALLNWREINPDILVLCCKL